MGDPALAHLSKDDPDNGTPAAGPIPLTWWRGPNRPWHVSCAHCHTELAVGDDLPDAITVATTNATARPCCDAWSTTRTTSSTETTTTTATPTTTGNE